MTKKRPSADLRWYTIDLHLHTPASIDYQQPEVTNLDILQRAETRGLDSIGITDHNTVAGYKRMQEEIQQLELLEKLNRLLPEESFRLKEYRRLLSKILVLPGFEFTAMLGFHIIGLFSPNKPVREIEFLLLDLNIPPEQLDRGSDTVGATVDVISAYQKIHAAGGLVIAAHANSSNGVAMRGFGFGGQTRIAFTQDTHLHALEVTDLEQTGKRLTATFFNGTKPEYPRRMHCIQGTDAHRLTMDPQRKKILGVGDRATEVLLPEMSFEALKDLFASNDFARTRPRRYKEEPAFDFIQVAREEGPNIIQEFHPNMTVRGGNLYEIIADVCAFANTNGGTLYIGLNSDPKTPPLGITNPEQNIAVLEKEIGNRISPPLSCAIDTHEAGGKKILRVLVPRGEDPPYAVDDNKIYVRDEAETGLAVRDEIVSLVMRGEQAKKTLVIPPEAPGVKEIEPPGETGIAFESKTDLAPRTGVEVVSMENREGSRYYTMRDLRNGNMVKNVTRTSARKLWHYAISEHAKLPPDLSQYPIQWSGEYGLLNRHKQGKFVRYDLIQRQPKGYRFYFGVTDDGIHGPWRQLVGIEDDRE